MKIKILQEDCSPAAAEDRTLPHTAYLVTYEVNGIVKYDIAMGSKKVDIFDHYWDTYGIVRTMKPVSYTHLTLPTTPYV